MNGPLSYSSSSNLKFDNSVPRIPKPLCAARWGCNRAPAPQVVEIPHLTPRRQRVWVSCASWAASWWGIAARRSSLYCTCAETTRTAKMSRANSACCLVCVSSPHTLHTQHSLATTRLHCQPASPADHAQPCHACRTPKPRHATPRLQPCTSLPASPATKREKDSSADPLAPF